MSRPRSTRRHLGNLLRHGAAIAVTVGLLTAGWAAIRARGPEPHQAAPLVAGAAWLALPRSLDNLVRVDASSGRVTLRRSLGDSSQPIEVLNAGTSAVVVARSQRTGWVVDARSGEERALEDLPPGTVALAGPAGAWLLTADAAQPLDLRVPGVATDPEGGSPTRPGPRPLPSGPGVTAERALVGDDGRFWALDGTGRLHCGHADTGPACPADGPRHPDARALVLMGDRPVMVGRDEAVALGPGGAPQTRWRLDLPADARVARRAPDAVVAASPTTGAVHITAPDITGPDIAGPDMPGGDDPGGDDPGGTTTIPLRLPADGDDPRLTPTPRQEPYGEPVVLGRRVYVPADNRILVVDRDDPGAPARTVPLPGLGTVTMTVHDGHVWFQGDRGAGVLTPGLRPILAGAGAGFEPAPAGETTGDSGDERPPPPPAPIAGADPTDPLCAANRPRAECPPTGPRRPGTASDGTPGPGCPPRWFDATCPATRQAADLDAPDDPGAPDDRGPPVEQGAGARADPSPAAPEAPSPAPGASFAWRPGNPTAHDPVDFEITATVPWRSAHWAFPGSSTPTSDDPAPRVVWPRAGRYDVTLTLTGPDVPDGRLLVTRTVTVLGPRQVGLPRLTGLTLGRAREALAEVGLRPGADDTHRSGRAPGTVLWARRGAQRLDPDAVLNVGDTVDLTASDGRGPAEIVAGPATTCVRHGDLTATCWGLSAGDPFVGELPPELEGLLDPASPGGTLAPQAVDGLTGATHLAIGHGHLCAIVGGPVACWGDNHNGVLGGGATTGSDRPVPVPGLDAATALALGQDHSCALQRGQALCWGNNSRGQLGDGTVTPSPVARPVPGWSGITAIAAGPGFTCALDSAGAVSCIGSPLSVWPPAVRSQVRPVPWATGVRAISAGGSFLCVVWIAGGNGCGPNAGGETLPADWPQAPTRSLPDQPDGAVVQLDAGSEHVCGRLASGAVLCHGQAWGGVLGDGESWHWDRPENEQTPYTARPVGIADAEAIAVGDSHACALRAEGRITCWGSGTSGQLGTGTVDEHPLPVDVHLPP